MIDVTSIRKMSSFNLPGKRKPVGVVGGMGSLATAKFLEVLAQRSEAKKDQDHIPFVVLSLPNVSDRSRAISIGSDAPLQQILERVHWLEKAGCGAIVIPCNTAHFWAAEIKQALSVDFINMIEITTKFILRSLEHKTGRTHSILLGTDATMKKSVYSEIKCKLLCDDASPHLKEIHNDAVKTIDDVKAGDIAKAKENLVQLVKKARTLNPDLIIFACSELSAISSDFAEDNDIVDPINILAEACIDWWQNAN